MLPALEIIPKRRRKLGLTQSQLAELAGVSQSYIAKLEAGTLSQVISRSRRSSRHSTGLIRKNRSLLDR